MIEEVHLFTDGGVRPTNPGPGAVGILVLDPAGRELESRRELIWEVTNNEAEYVAVILGLQTCARHTRTQVRCFSDSKLIVNQLNDRWGFRRLELRAFHDEVKRLARLFQSVVYRHVRREHPNLVRADALVNEAFRSRRGSR